MNNSNQLYERYSRQIALKTFGEAGQQKLLQSRILMIGAGGLGCAALQYLAAAGIGHIGIMDYDTVSLNNLHRQVLYGVNNIGSPKAVTAAAVLLQANPGICITAINDKLTVTNALEIIQQYDIVIDGTDNFAARYLVNDACFLLNKPLVYGAVSKFEGQVAVFNVLLPDGNFSTNYRDLFPQPPAAGEVANCAETGVLGILPGIIGTMQAAEVIKLISGIGTPLINRLVSYNALNNQLFEMQLAPRSDTNLLIPENEAAFLAMDYDWLCGNTGDTIEIDTTQFDALRKNQSVAIIDVRELNEMPVVDEFIHLQLPLGNIEEQFQDTEHDTIVVFCQSGKRSLLAARMLADKFADSKKIFSLAGGILKWKQENNLKK
ncbi:MAG: molybdopterin-synthase adenylyltransferase MoeB [Chitinophagaceae bacterium]